MKTCKRCSRPVRLKSEPEQEGVVPTIGRQLCQPCWRACKADGTLENYPPGPRGPGGEVWTTDACHGGCGKRVRRARLKVADFPGTLIDEGGRRCGPCRSEQFHNGQGGNRATVEQNKASLDAYLATRRPSKLVKVVKL